MDNLVREGEQAMDGQSGGGNNQGNMGGGGGNMDQQGQGNMGGGGGNMNEQSGGNQSSGGGGGFMSGLENTGKDAMIDQEVNQFATKEGVPGAADGVIDGMVNKEL